MIYRPDPRLTVERVTEGLFIPLNAGIYQPPSLAERLFGVPILGRVAAAAAEPQPFPPDPVDPRILILDLSSHQGEIDWDILAAFGDPTVQAVHIRSGGGTEHLDSRFVFNWTQAKRVGKPRSAYWYLRGDQSGIAQGRAFLQSFHRVQDDWGEGPFVIDIERRDGATPRELSLLAWDFIDYVQTHSNKECWVYSGAWFVNNYMEFQGWFTYVKWWLAHWYSKEVGREHPGPPARPNGVTEDQVMEHQTTSFLKGGLFGATSKAIDGNRWQSDPALFKKNWGIEEEPGNGEEPSDLEQQVEQNSVEIQLLQERVSSLEGQQALIFQSLQIDNQRLDYHDERITALEEGSPTPPPQIPGFSLGSPLTPPLSQYRLSQDFNKNIHNYQGVGGHDGLDWAIEVGTPIIASHKGRVTVSGYRPDRPDYDPYGDHVRIELEARDHNETLRVYTTIYAHLSQLLVDVGDVVETGQIIGLSGGVGSRSGYSTGPHLHFGVICQGAKGRGETFLNGDFMNPWLWLGHLVSGENLSVQLLQRRRVTAGGLNARNAIGTEGTIVRFAMVNGTIFSVYEDTGGEWPWGAHDISRTTWSSIHENWSERVE
jgi:murein DD-endopeptidase MepM/ murein hydrolase activator NlpD